MAASQGHPSRQVTIWKLVGILLVTALLAAGVLLPYVGGLGVVAGQESDKFLNSSCTLTETAPPQKSTLYANDGKTVIATLFTQDRTPVTLDQVPKYLVQGLIDTEDRRFYSHHGVDMRGLIRSALNTSSGDTQGGSTLTMQYVKQVRLYQAGKDTAAQEAAVDQNINRKIQDARCAIDLEKVNTKDQILDKYLNIAFFGENSYGIGTAAKTYFGKDVSQLTLPEAALLVGVVRAPSLYDPFVNKQGATDRRNEVVQNMVNEGDLSAADGAKYQATPISLATLKPPEVKQGCSNAPGTVVDVGFFCDQVVNWLETTGGISDTTLTSGGLSVVTTLDPSLQNSLQASLAGPNGIPAASASTAILPVVDPRSGNILAMATSKNYGNAASDPSTTSLPIFTTATTSPASTYKLFSLLAALTAGVPSNFALGAKTNKYDTARNYIANNCVDPATTVSNNDPNESFSTNETLTSATAKSSNTYFLQLTDQLFGCDLTPVLQIAQQLGLSELSKPIDSTHKQTVAQQIIAQNQTGFLIGSTSAAATPLELTAAYAAVANDGTYCTPAPVVSITDFNGKPLQVKRTPCSQVIATQVARQAANILRGDTTGSGTSRTAFGGYYGSGGGPVAGKTGTNNASTATGAELPTNSSLWFVGITPHLAATTAVVNLSSPNSPLTGLPGYSDAQAGAQAYGVYAAKIWLNALTPTLKADTWSWPSPTAVSGGVTVPPLTGKTADAAKALLASVGLKAAEFTGDANVHCGSSVTYNNVAFYSPQIAEPGSTVTYCLSDFAPTSTYVPPAPRPTVAPTAPGATPGAPAVPGAPGVPVPPVR